MAKVRVAQWGLGAMGTGIVKCLVEREGVEIVGAASRRFGGVDLGEAVGLGRELGVKIFADPNEMLEKVEADVLFLTTESFVKAVYPQIMAAVKKKMNVITIAEEMLYPHVRFPRETKEMDVAAKANNVSVLGTGINPGFILDTLILALTGPCTKVEKVYAQRINDLSPFGVNVMNWQGVGFNPDEFEKGVNNGSIVGHVGFFESISLIADCLGWKIDEIKQERTPIVSKVYRETPFIKVQPGQTAGSIQIGHGIINGKKVITLEHPQMVRPEVEGVQVKDKIVIDGEPKISMEIVPEIAGGIGTIAMAVNMIAHVIKAQPGVVTMKDLPLPYYWKRI